MISPEVFALILTGLSITASIVYYASVLMNTERSRRAQLVSRMREQIWGLEGGKVGMELMNMRWTSFDDFDSKYDSTVNPDNYTKRFWIWGIFQEMGYMLHENLLDIDTIYTMLGGHNARAVADLFPSIIVGTYARA